jgi:proline dehydrogenase
VKGAYNESPAVAYPKKSDVDACYLDLAAELIERAGRWEASPVFGTHDGSIIAQIAARARAGGLAKGTYEIHMLYGIRTQEQRALAAGGTAVRVLISYGSAWFAWYMRRLAERPANVWFVVRNLV